MKLIHSVVACAIVVLAFHSFVHAQEVVFNQTQATQPSGVYQKVFGGWSELDGFKIQALPTPLSINDSSRRLAGGGVQGGSGLPAPPAPAKFNEGFLLGGSVGTQLTSRTRIELEASWRSNSGRRTNNFGSEFSIDGHINNYTTMLNLLADIPLDAPINFYGGLGIGVSRQDGEFASIFETVDVDDWAFAYQAITGVSFRGNRNWKLFAEYRYFGNTLTKITAPAADEVNFNYVAENILFGISFQR